MDYYTHLDLNVLLTARRSGQILSTLLGVSTDELLSLIERGITGDTPYLDD